MVKNVKRKSSQSNWRVETNGTHSMHAVFEDESGSADLRYHPLFSGIVLADIRVAVSELAMVPPQHVRAMFSSSKIFADSFAQAYSQSDQLMSINYCTSGRCECDVGEFGSVIVQEQDLCFSTLTAHSFSYPTASYTGFEFWVNFAALDAEARALFVSFGIDIESMRKQLCAGRPAFVVQAEGQMKDACASLCALLKEEQAEGGALRLASLQLFRAACSIDANTSKDCFSYVQKSQRDLAHAVHDALVASPEDCPSVGSLAQEFGVSEASLRSYFRRVYGTTPAAFVRSRALRRASDLLRETDAAVSDVATQVGYTNPSKFSAAFRKEMGANPLEYRRRCRLAAKR